MIGCKMGIVGSGGAAPFSFGNALLFDGVDDYVITQPNTFNNLFYNASDFYTVSGWFNPINISSYPMLLSKSVANEFFLELGNTAGVVYWRNGGNIRTYNSTGWALNAWNHYAIVKNGIGDSGDLYINGLLQAPVVGVIGTTINSPTEHLIIGAYWNGTTNKFGTMDETAIWNGTAATQQNITDLYNNGNGALASSIIANPTAYWRFNESGADIILTDETTNYIGDLINFPASGMWVANRTGQTPTVMYPDWDVVEANITVSGGGTATNKILRTAGGVYEGALDSLMGLDDFVFDYIVGSVNENYKFLGLSNQNIQAQSNDMLFGFFLVNINDVRIRENQGDKHYFTVIQGDKMTIQRIGGTIYYYKNNVLIFNSTLVNGNEVYPIGLPGDPNVFVEGIKITGFIYGS